MNFLLIQLGKTIALLARILHLGTGGAWPGEVILRLNKNFIKQMESKLKHGSIVLSGTNGKTTTALMIAAILRQAGYKVLHNHSGANLLNGLASSFITDANFWGKLRSEIGVFELDEANLPKALKNFTPEIVLLLNLSRDQLDRYGEVEIMLEKWNESFVNLPPETKLIINRDDQRLMRLNKKIKAKIANYGLADDQGQWSSSLIGRFNQMNTLAAVKTTQNLDIKDQDIKRALNEFKPAFGRGEEFNIDKKKIKIFLAKNPASFNANLTLILENLPQARCLLFALNDNIPDGRDVSWIYDIDPIKLKQACDNKKIFVSGTRHLDMLLRLKYAEVNYQDCWHSEDLEKMIKTMIRQAEKDELCLILPTYSAMLESRKILCGKKIL